MANSIGAPAFKPWEQWPRAGSQWPRYNIESDQARGLVAAWPMFASVGKAHLAELAHGYGGTLTNGIAWAHDSEMGPVLSFDGDDDFVELGTIPVNHPLQLGQIFTIACWFYQLSGGDDWQRIIAKSSAGNCANGWGLFLGTGAGSGEMYAKVNTVNRQTFYSVYSQNAWTHVLWQGTGAASGSTCWVNGSTVSFSDDNAYTMPDVATGARIGSWNHSTGREFKGYIADIRLWDRLFTDTEAAALYDRLTRWQLYELPKRVWYVAVGVGDLSIAVSDSVSVAESVTISLPDALSASTSDSVSVVESAVLALVSHVAVSDAVGVAEGVGQILEGHVSVSDAVGVAESTVISQHRSLSVSDAVGVAESVGHVLLRHLSVSDAIGVAENVARTLVSHVSVSDSVSAAEAVAARLIAHVSVSDAVGIAESVNLSIVAAGTLTVNVSDTVTLGESDSADVSDPQASASDSVTVGESVGVSVISGYSISVSDAVAVAESVSLALADLSLSVSESVAAAESVGTLLASFVSVSETISTAEAASAAPETQIGVSDSVGVAESTSAAVSTSVIVSESISVTDSPTVSVEGLVADRNVSVSESLSVSDVAVLAVFLAAGPPGLRVATDLAGSIRVGSSSIGSIRAGSSDTPTLRTTKTLK